MTDSQYTLDQAAYDKAEHDAMKALGTLVRSTKTEPEHRIAAANAMLTHVRQRGCVLDVIGDTETVGG